MWSGGLREQAKDMFALSHDPEHEYAAPDKFREGKMGGILGFQ